MLSEIWQFLQDHWREILQVIFLILLILLILMLLSRKRRSQKSQSSGSGSGHGNSSSSAQQFRSSIDDMLEELRQPSRSHTTTAMELTRAVLESEPDLAALLLREARENMTPREALQDDEAIRRIAGQVGLNKLRIIGSAARTVPQLENIELTTSDELVEVPYPGDTFIHRPMLNDGEIQDVIPEDLALPDEVFDQRLSQQELTVERNLERLRNKRRLVILLDISPSMDRGMRDGTERIQWAGGVALKLMLRALAGEAEFIFRFFDDGVSKRYIVTSPEEAQIMSTRLLRLVADGNGTDIDFALRQAVNDIVDAETEVQTSDVLLITDGESNLDEYWMRETFVGSDTRLHVCLIGRNSNPLLEEVSTSYDMYS